jgi:hypothetical protein
MFWGIAFLACVAAASAACLLGERLSGINGDGYRGCQNKTRSGFTCQAWSAQSPQPHAYNTPELNNSSGLDANYCRNPDGEQGIWYV